MLQFASQRLHMDDEVVKTAIRADFLAILDVSREIAISFDVLGTTIERAKEMKNCVWNYFE